MSSEHPEREIAAHTNEPAPGDEQTSTGVTRRDVMKRGAALGGAVIWATPVVQSFAARPAFATEENGDNGTGKKKIWLIWILILLGSKWYWVKCERGSEFSVDIEEAEEENGGADTDDVGTASSSFPDHTLVKIDDDGDHVVVDLEDLDPDDVNDRELIAEDEDENPVTVSYDEEAKKVTATS